jgi:hypothetical protein
MTMPPDTGQRLWGIGRRLGTAALALFFLGIVPAATGHAQDFPYTGIWQGTSRGGDDVTWTARVDTDGQIRATGTSRLAGAITASGVVTAAGGLTMQAAGPVSTGATYRGTVRPNGTTSGTWENRFAKLSGTFSGRRTDAMPIPPECRQEFTAANPPPAGYGAAYDVFARGNPLVIRGLGRATANATVSVGSGAPSQYIYRYAHEWRNNQWIRVTLEGTDRQGDWFVGGATGELTRPFTDLAWPSYVVAYICNRVADAWRCGCSDAACQTPRRQLQAFRRLAVLQ